MRRLFVVIGLAVLVAGSAIVLLALGLSLAWDEVPSPPEPITSWLQTTVAAAAVYAAHPSGGRSSRVAVFRTARLKGG